MNQTNKYILELETKLKEYQAEETQWLKEQSASIQLFKDKEQEIKNLNASLNELFKEQGRVKERSQQITKKSQEQVRQLAESKKKIKELEQDNQKLYQAVKDGLRSYEDLEKSWRVTQEQLTAEQEKNVILENKIRELQEQVKEGNLPPPIVYDKGSWETEKEELLSQFEETRNEQGREIEKLEKENNQLDQDLNQAVDLLEAKDKTISKLANQNQELTKELQTKKSAINKTFFCDSCQLTKQGEYIKRKVDAPFWTKIT